MTMLNLKCMSHHKAFTVLSIRKCLKIIGYLVEWTTDSYGRRMEKQWHKLTLKCK